VCRTSTTSYDNVLPKELPKKRGGYQNYKVTTGMERETVYPKQRSGLAEAQPLVGLKGMVNRCNVTGHDCRLP